LCGWTQDGDAKTMKRWIVSAVAALMALLLVPPPRAVARVRAPAGSARRSRRWIWSRLSAHAPVGTTGGRNDRSEAGLAAAFTRTYFRRL